MTAKNVPRKFKIATVCGRCAAEKEGKTPAEVAKHYNAKQLAAFSGLNIKFDIYGSTSRCPYHTQLSQDFFLAIHKKGYFEKQEVLQFFDPQKKVFLPDRFVKGSCGYCEAADQNGDQCENCGRVLDTKSLKNPRSVFTGADATVEKTVQWMLDLSRCRKEVEAWLAGAVLRDSTRAFVSGLMESGLVKRSMTRDISWGIPIPLDDPDAKSKVLYVWFDAPIGYISFTKELCATREGNPDAYKEWWQSEDVELYHFIGEDNTIFHTVIWIAMLSLEGVYKLPKGVIVNSFLNIKFPGSEIEKMSKSRGTALWIEDYLAEQGNSADMLRYYLTRIAPENARAVYKPEDLINRNNGELADILGNFVHRVLQFTLKYVGPKVPTKVAEKRIALDQSFIESLHSAHAKVTKLIEEFKFRDALAQIMGFAQECNLYIDSKAPWTSRKTDMQLTEYTLACSLDAIKGLGIMLLPFLPESAEKILTFLDIDPATAQWSDALIALEAGHVLHTPTVLFPKIIEKESTQ